jgi:hypothetical protein
MWWDNVSKLYGIGMSIRVFERGACMTELRRVLKLCKSRDGGSGYEPGPLNVADDDRTVF